MPCYSTFLLGFYTKYLKEETMITFIGFGTKNVTSKPECDYGPKCSNSVELGSCLLALAEGAVTEFW